MINPLKFEKYHALGNDYLVLDPEFLSPPPSPADIMRVCHRNFGLGSDGILYGPLPTDAADFGLRIFNPDGSEAEKSGNGLRIFARYLADRERIQPDQAFTVHTPGGVVEATVFAGKHAIEVEMGRVSFRSGDIPVSGADREVIEESIEIDGESRTFCAATIGNPHAVFPVDRVSADEVRRIGPVVESHPLFPNRTNVQLLEIIDRKTIRIEIWERGAGYTLASGSSSSACAAVARRLGHVDSGVTVKCPGGDLQIVVSDAFDIRMTGPVTRVGPMTLVPEALL